MVCVFWKSFLLQMHPNHVTFFKIFDSSVLIVCRTSLYNCPHFFVHSFHLVRQTLSIITHLHLFWKWN
ncbi:hypothetical protein PRUPE_8G229100 [Prunus persica]|uniref:Uncharacterized protein n=1 Tax=Prunus persica TaxID=3760 RepID=M5VN85_PRUPE|nr:hypothetical protein PRUPE_8G229100 [Prunus persica]